MLTKGIARAYELGADRLACEALLNIQGEGRQCHLCRPAFDSPLPAAGLLSERAG